MSVDPGTLGLPTDLLLLLAACVLLATSGVPGLLIGARGARGEAGARIATALTVAGSLVGLAGGVLALSGPFAAGGSGLELASPLPGLRTTLGVDALSAFFALPVFLVGGLGSVYGHFYWTPSRHPRNGRRLRFCYGLLLGSLALITLARDGIALLVAWEVMALSNFFLVTIEEERPTVRQAGWLYLLFSHVTILGLFALFLLERQVTGQFAFGVISADAPAPLRLAIFVLALVAFGTKAGAMPLHSWLPAAHASAPSHVSAVMSGVVIKMGIYGLVRICGLLESPPLSWGIALLVAGSVSAFFGVVLALSQHDLKRLLAYHSIENIGIMLLGLGLAMAGRTLDRPEWVVLGLAGCLLHMWNHALFKSLLFLGAGSVTHGAGTRDLEQMGGLSRRMPVTAGLFLLASVAICGLPPGNGFVSELLVYLGLLRAAVTPGAAWAALPAPVLAATGALAVACFVKVYGVVFLGTARTERAVRAHESPRPMLWAMGVLAAACVTIGAVPGLLAPALDRAVTVWTGTGAGLPRLATLVPFSWMPVVFVALLAVSGLAAVALSGVWRRARSRAPRLPTWDCGYAATSPRLQYTASSFAELITSRFAWALWPRVRMARLEEILPSPSRFHAHVDDPVLGKLLEPTAGAAHRASTFLRALPQGQLQRYILYILAVLLPLLVWAVTGGGGEG